jgi:peptidoglycan-associated lipoprotein
MMKRANRFRDIFWHVGVLIAVGIFVLSGCATKKYVEEQITPVENRVSKTEADISKLGDGIASNESKIEKVETELDQADAKADRALSTFGDLRLERRQLLDMRQGANFAVNSARLADEAKQSIDLFLDNLKDRIPKSASPIFLVAGHTDNTGPEDVNFKLGECRAESVKRYLITKKGIDPLSVVKVSFGETSPIVRNDTQKDRAKNRRVEILVYGEEITQ